jgi:Fe2+ transport system protein FeoA
VIILVQEQKQTIGVAESGNMKYTVTDVPQKDPCDKCVPCIRLRLMEMGFIEGQEIEVEEKKLGLHLVNILSEFGDVLSTIAMRPEELNRICLK